MKMEKSSWQYSSALVVLLILGLAVSPALAQKKGKNGTTLAAAKTVDVCELPGGQWQYSGVVGVWNEGAVDTENLTINDRVESNDGSGWVTICSFQPLLQAPPEAKAGTTCSPSNLLNCALAVTYSCTADPAVGTVRNTATLTITNHSGKLGTPFGPEPKATFMGTVEPCPGGCVYTLGYWKTHSAWPSPYSQSDSFFSNPAGLGTGPAGDNPIGKTWQNVLDTPPGGNGYYILAHQYIAAALNLANGAPIPSGELSIINQAADWFAANSPSACTGPGSCGQQKSWAAILDTYNNGLSVGGPPHCE